MDMSVTEIAFVEKELADRPICERCQATLNTYAAKCTADLAEVCPGFQTIEAVREKFKRGDHEQKQS